MLHFHRGHILHEVEKIKQYRKSNDHSLWVIVFYFRAIWDIKLLDSIIDLVIYKRTWNYILLL